MAWNDEPPTKKELESSTSDWTKEPPTDDELGKISKLESALRGGAQGLTLNTAPAISGGVSALIDKLKGSDKDFSDLYTEGRESSQKAFKKAEEQNPLSYTAGSMAGSLPLTALLPEMGALKAGALLGAASGAGKSLSRGEGLTDIASDAAKEGALGGLLGGTVGKAIEKLSPSALEQSADVNTLKAFQAIKSQIKKIASSPSREQDGDRLAEVAANLRKPNEFTSEPVLNVFDDAAKRSDKVQDLAEKTGKYIEDFRKSADEQGIKTIVPKDIVDQIDQLQSQYLSKNPELAAQGLPKPTAVNEFNALSKLKQTVEEYGDQPISFGDAQDILSEVKRLAYSGEKVNPDMSQIYGSVKNLIDTKLDDVAKSAPGIGDFQKYLKAKDLYRTTQQIAPTTENTVAKEISNRAISPSDYATGLVGAAEKGGLYGLAAGAANKLTRTYGPAATAKAQQWSADKMRQISTKISDFTPDQFKNIGSKMMSSENETAQKLGRILDNLSEKDGTGRNATIFSLMQIPAYREFLNQITE